MDKRIDAYRSLKELNDNELLQLKENVFYALDTIPGNNELTQEELDTINACEKPSDIPYSILETLYGYIGFVDEDFFCNKE